MADIIVKGKKYRVMNDIVNKIWDVISWWTSSEDVECNDGETVEEKIGGLKGITTSTAVTEEGYAVDATAFNSFRNEVNQSLTLDFSNASSDVQNINTLLQNLLDKFYPKLFNFITDTNNTWWGGNMDTITYNGSTIVMRDTGKDNSISDFYAYMKNPVTLKGDNPVLTFDANCSAGSGGAASYSFHLEISKDGSNWTSLINQQKSLSDYGTVSVELNCSEKSLMDYAGEKVYFKLRVSASNNLYGGASFNISKFELP